MSFSQNDVAIYSLIVAGLSALFTYWTNRKKSSVDEVTAFRDDLLERIKQQDATIDSLDKRSSEKEKMINDLNLRMAEKDEQLAQLKERMKEKENQNKDLEERVGRMRAEITELIKKSSVEIANWRESYYLALNEYQKMKIENQNLKTEIENLRSEYERLRSEHEELKSKVSL